MQEFQVLDEKRYPLKISNSKDLLPYWRFDHRVTLGLRNRSFLVFVDNLKQEVFIEEITAGGVEKIQDESLWESLSEFAKEKGFLGILIPIMKNLSERFI